jgi:hypothetical protein
LRRSNTRRITTTIVVAEITILGTCVKGTFEDGSTRLTGEKIGSIKVVDRLAEGTGVGISIHNWLGLLKPIDG